MIKATFFIYPVIFVKLVDCGLNSCRLGVYQYFCKFCMLNVGEALEAAGLIHYFVHFIIANLFYARRIN